MVTICVSVSLTVCVSVWVAVTVTCAAKFVSGNVTGTTARGSDVGVLVELAKLVRGVLVVGKRVSAAAAMGVVVAWAEGVEGDGVAVVEEDDEEEDGDGEGVS